MTDSLKDVLVEKDEKLKENGKMSKLGKTKLKMSEKLQAKIIEQIKQDQVAQKEGKFYKLCSALEYRSAKFIILEILKKGREESKTCDKESRTYTYYPIFVIEKVTRHQVIIDA